MLLNNYQVPKGQLNSRISTEFDSEDMSGETSATDSVHKGIKPKEVKVSFVLPFEEQESLSKFYSVAESVDSNGDLVVYEITDRNANAANVRRVVFTKRINQVELDGLNAWQVSFTLRERFSTSEKVEQRLQVSEVAATESQGVAVTPSQQEEQSYTVFERALIKFDKSLGDETT